MDLIDQLNSLTTYPSIDSLHAIAAQVQALSASDQTTLLSQLNSRLLATDLSRYLDGSPPSLITAPVVVAPTMPGTPDHPVIDLTTDPGIASNAPPQIKPVAV